MRVIALSTIFLACALAAGQVNLHTAAPAPARPQAQSSAMTATLDNGLVITTDRWTYDATESFGKTLNDVEASSRYYQQLAESQKGGVVNFTTNINGRRYRRGSLSKRDAQGDVFNPDGTTFIGMNNGQYGTISSGELMIGLLVGKHIFYRLNPATGMAQRMMIRIGDVCNAYYCDNPSKGLVAETTVTDFPKIRCPKPAPSYEMSETQPAEVCPPAPQQAQIINNNYQTQTQSQVMVVGSGLQSSSATTYVRVQGSLPFFFPNFGGGRTFIGTTPIGPIYCPPGRPGISGLPGAYIPGYGPNNPFRGPIPNFPGPPNTLPGGTGQVNANGH